MTEDTFANSPFGLIIEAKQALHTSWTLVGPGWDLGGLWMAPAGFKFACGALGFRRVNLNFFCSDFAP